MTRPTWDETWLDFARTMAKRSTDPRLKVGAILVTRDNCKILATGYNGGARGISNEPDSLEKGLSGMVHAELNALIKAEYTTQDRVIYITDSPCLMCAKALVNGRVSEVIYEREYRDTSGIELLRLAGVTVRRFVPIFETLANTFAFGVLDIDGVEAVFADDSQSAPRLIVVATEHMTEIQSRVREVEEAIMDVWPGFEFEVCVRVTQGKCSPESVASGRRIEMSGKP